MRLLAWLRRVFRVRPIEEWSDEEVLQKWADYSATKDWWAVEMLRDELQRRGIA